MQRLAPAVDEKCGGKLDAAILAGAGIVFRQIWPCARRCHSHLPAITIKLMQRVVRCENMERVPTFLFNRIAVQPSAGFRIIEGVDTRVEAHQNSEVK
jgi:hypothetical protein